VLAEGTGDGAMIIRNVAVKQIEKIGVRPDDWVVLSDRTDWPMALDGYRVGLVRSIVPSRSPGFAEVRLLPVQSLVALREVMVMKKEKG
jgi:hypothetical protein